jgi:hypothetical protein
MLVRLADGDLASLTIIRKPDEFSAQLRSYGFSESAGASSPIFADMQTATFFDTVAGVFSVSRDRPFTYIVPDGLNRADWLVSMETKAHDPRFTVVERDGELVHCMIVPSGEV